MKVIHGLLKKEGLRGGIGPLISIIVLIVLLVISGFSFWYQSKKYTSDLIVDDIQRLQEIFIRIDKRCRILGFDYQKNPINFLNTIKFEGSEVGSMNLGYPTQWEGPYMEDNPTLQGLEYEIVRTKNGYFIVPGDGVLLPNGKRVGKDITLDENADIQAMMKDEKALMFKGKAFAAPLLLETKEWQKVMLEDFFGSEDDLAIKEKHDEGWIRLAAR